MKLSIVLKQINRNKIKFVISSLVLSMLFTMFIMFYLLAEKTIESNFSDIVNTKADLWITAKDSDYVNGLFLDEKVISETNKLSFIKQSEPIIEMFGILEYKGKPISINMTSYKDKGIRAKINILDGGLPRWKLANGIVVDDSVASSAKMTLGDKVKIGSQEFEIAGFSHGYRQFNRPLVFIPFQMLKFASGNSKQVSYVLAAVKQDIDPIEAKRKIEQKIKDVDVLTKQDYLDRMASELAFVSSIIAGLEFLVAVMVFLIISSTMTNQVLNNIRNYGTLKCIGANDSYLSSLVLVHGLMISIFGFIISVLVMWILGITLKELFPVDLSLTPASLVFSLGIIILISVISSFLALGRIKRIEPSVALKAL